MFRIRYNCVFIQGNLKYKTPRIYSVRRAAWLMTHSRLKLTWIDSRFNPVWKLIPFERALNCIQYMRIRQHSYIYSTGECFYIANCLIKRKQLMNMMIYMFMTKCIITNCSYTLSFITTLSMMSKNRRSFNTALMNFERSPG